MTGYDLFFLLSTVLGGLALFIFGMQVMTDGLRHAVGAQLQRLLAKTTRYRLSGFLLGTALGATIHSSAAAVMLVSFVNAGLITLGQSIAPILGANVGTTLSMQVISLRLGDYAYVAIAGGLLISLGTPSSRAKYFGRALLGFGLLFLGMEIMSAAIRPHRDLLALYLQGIDGDRFTGLLIGIGISTGLTAVWQSSGATIAIIFAMISGGVFTSFSQIFPIVLGAHLGTCATGLLGSIGANIEARRCAMAHLFFNLFNVLLAIAAMPLFYWLIPMTSPDLIRQTANLHTAVMLVAALIVLPVSCRMAPVVRWLISRRQPIPEYSHLEYGLISYPERGIVAILSELQRVARVCSHSLYLTAHVVLHKHKRGTIATIKKNEQVINDVKLALGDYIATMTRRYLSRRQIIMFHHLNRCMADIERIGDHIDQLCDASLRRPGASLDKESIDALFALYVESKRNLATVIESLDPSHEDFQARANKIMTARDQYIQCSMDANEKFMKKVENHEISPAAALYFKDYISIMDRMNRHIKSIALAQKHEDFWIKRFKLNKPTQPVGIARFHEVNPDDYLDQLHHEDYL